MKLHFIGIGGISMSALATLMLARGHQVSGSDIQTTPLIEKLISKGVRFFNRQTAENIAIVQPDQVIYTAAINKHNPELQAAYATGKPVLVRADFLGQLTAEYARSIAVAGTHGKTTTTAMLTLALRQCQTDPTALVGGEFTAIDGNLLLGKSDIFLTEACEYQESFLSLKPFIGIILNIDKDHMDYFRDFQHIIQAFSAFSRRIVPHGCLIISGDDPCQAAITAGLTIDVKTFGLNQHNDWYADDIKFTQTGSSFTVYNKQKRIATLSLQVPGIHNIKNALATLATCQALKLELEPVIMALNSFKGTHRRFEFHGFLNGARIYDDYAHHPQEIMTTLQAAKQTFHPKRIIVVFQPHTYSRTKALLNEFATSFELVDELFVTKTYAAREPYDAQGDSLKLVAAIKKNNPQVKLIPTYQEAAQVVKEMLGPGDLLLTMGAGPVNRVIDYLL